MFSLRVFCSISGPNTGHEWSKEGHRSFPLMPRSEPHTALQHIANHAVSVAVAQNQLLPMPSETGRNYEPNTLPTSILPVVMEDPVNKILTLSKPPPPSLLNRICRFRTNDCDDE